MRYVILLLSIAFSIVNAAAADPITLTFDGTLDSLYPLRKAMAGSTPLDLAIPSTLRSPSTSPNRPILWSCLPTPTLD